MRQIFFKIRHELTHAGQRYEISMPITITIVLLPIVISSIYGFMLLHHVTRDLAKWMHQENRPIELLTFASLFIAGLKGLALAWEVKRSGESIFIYGFYAVFSIGMLFTAMEEIAWGQWFLGFETPTALIEINVQRELTIHNIEGLHGHTEFLRIAFGIGGIFGVWLSDHQQLHKIGAPFILLPWFLVISVLATLDLYNDYLPMWSQLNYLVKWFAELVEMLIGMAGLLYVLLNSQMLSKRWRHNLQMQS